MLLCSIVDENEWNYVCKYKYENGDLIKKYIKFKPNEYIAFTIVELRKWDFCYWRDGIRKLKYGKINNNV